MALALDTNLMTLLVATAADRDIIVRHKRLQTFSVVDGNLLENLIATDRLIVTPGVITETSNLLRQTRQPDAATLTAALGELIRSSWTEVWHPHARVVSDPLFEELGAADLALLDAAEQRPARLLTVDARLAAVAMTRDIAATNFNYLRGGAS